jgi:hypothetical protein
MKNRYSLFCLGMTVLATFSNATETFYSATGTDDDYNRVAPMLQDALKVFREREFRRAKKLARLTPLVDALSKDLMEAIRDKPGWYSPKRPKQEEFLKTKLLEALRCLAPFQHIHGERGRLVLNEVSPEAIPAQEQLDALMGVIDAEGPDMRSRMNLFIRSEEDKIIEEKRSCLPIA